MRTVPGTVGGQCLVQYDNCTWYSRRTGLATFIFITEKIGERLTAGVPHTDTPADKNFVYTVLFLATCLWRLGLSTELLYTVKKVRGFPVPRRDVT